MLGPALTNLLHRLAEIPAPDRTPNQQALFEELNWLFAASLGEGPGHAASAQTNALRAAPEIQSFLDSDLVEEWLDPQEEAGQELVDEIVAGGAEVAQRVEFHEVSPAVGSVQNNGPELTDALG